MPEISEVIQYFLANNRGLAPAAAFGQKERGKRWLNQHQLEQSDRNVLTVAMDRVQKLGYVLVKHARYTAAEWDIDLKVNNLPLKHIEKKNPHVA